MRGSRLVPWLAMGGAALLVVMVGGCARSMPIGEVTGTATIDGTPAANVLVVFLPDASQGHTGPRSCGMTDEQGRYRLRCDDRRDGAVVGTHRVICEDLAQYARPRDENRPTETEPWIDRVPEAYRNALTTPLVTEVVEGVQTFDLHLTSEDAKAAAPGN